MRRNGRRSVNEVTSPPASESKTFLGKKIVLDVVIVHSSLTVYEGNIKSQEAFILQMKTNATIYVLKLLPRPCACVCMQVHICVCVYMCVRVCTCV